MGLIDDQEVWCGADEFVASHGGLDEIGGYDSDAVPVEQGLVHAETALQFRDGAGQDQCGVQAELVAQFRVPLFG